MNTEEIALLGRGGENDMREELMSSRSWGIEGFYKFVLVGRDWRRHGHKYPVFGPDSCVIGKSSSCPMLLLASTRDAGVFGFAVVANGTAGLMKCA